MERWKIISGTDGIYEVSSYGNVRRAKEGKRCKNGNAPTVKKGRVLRFIINKGYKNVWLTMPNGDVKWHSVHSLVAAAFIGKRPIGKHVNHKDLDRGNNYYRNLEYLTPKENTWHAKYNGRHVGGVRTIPNRIRVLLYDYYRTGNFTYAMLAKNFGISLTSAHNKVHHYRKNLVKRHRNRVLCHI